MPIPTDTFWNIKRLNIAFAVSSVALVGVILWSVVQDYDKTWRKPQRSARVWDAAMTEEKIQRMMSPAEQERLADLRSLLADLDNAVKSGGGDFKGLAAKIDKIEAEHTAAQVMSARDAENLQTIKASLAAIETALSDPAKQAKIKEVPGYDRQIAAINSRIETATFSLNNYKAILTVDEGDLQRAVTAGNTARANELRELVDRKRKVVKDGGDGITGDEQIARWNDEIRELKEKKADALKEVDDLRKLTAKLGGDVELLRKKVDALDPDLIRNGAQRLAAKGSEQFRAAPLMQFLNPAEKVQQIVLPDVQTDVSFMKITTIDRCTTCHLNIDRREYSETNVLAYLEEQLATSRNVRFVAAEKPEDPTPANPGALGMPEFWHAYAVEVTPAFVVKSAERLNAVLAAIGKGVTVRADNNSFTATSYDLTASGDAKVRQDLVVGELLKAWSMFEPGAKPNGKNGKGNGELVSRSRRVQVTIASTVDAELAKAAREALFPYAVEAKTAVQQALNKKRWNQIEERYRYALVDEVNVHRKERGWRPLDASPSLLAHPRLDLYADMDSPHPKETLGCTACHDGSGQETNFVLAAHAPRSQWVDDTTGVPVLPQQITTAVESHHHADLSSMLETVLGNGVRSLHLESLAPHDKAHNGHDAHGDGHATTQPVKKDAHAKEIPDPSPADKPVAYVDPLTGERRRAVPQAKHWAQRYELESGTSFKDVAHYWDRPMRPAEFVEANCARCHTNIHDIKEEAPTLYAGRVAFAKNGCVNCHQMDSVPVEDRVKVGPDLRHVDKKLSEAFLNSWIWAPKAFRPSTKMPHFFMLENSSSDEELRRTQQEVRAITTYLLKTATPLPQSTVLANPANKMPEFDDSDDSAREERVARGRALFIGLENVRDPIDVREAGVGCVGCHTNLNETGEHWFVTDMTKKGLADEMAALTGTRPNANAVRDEARKRWRDGMTYNERQIYALENFGEDPASPDELPTYPDGAIKPVFQTHGPELSGIGTKLLAGRNRTAARKWLYDWLMDPRHYNAYTMMPRLRLTPDEALDLAEYLLAQTRKSKAPKDDWAAKKIEPDSVKVTELVAQFLKSQYSLNTAALKAADDAEMTKRATLALTNPSVDAKKAEEIASKLTLEEKQLVFLGQKLITHYGCMSCHAINGVEGVASPCANLSDWGQKAITKLDYGFADHHNVETFNATEQQRTGDTNAVGTAKIPMVNGMSVDAVTKLTDHLNAKKFGEELSKPAEVAWPHVDHTRDAWIMQKLKNPRIYDRGQYLKEPKRKLDANEKPVLDAQGNPMILDPGRPYDKLRMPAFYFSDEEVHAIVTFVLSNRDKLISPALLQKTNHDQAKQIATGRQIAERYNCVGCHRIESNTPAIQQYWLSEQVAGSTKFTFFLKDDLPAKGPPSLRSQGARAQSDWVFNFLKYVEREGTVQKEVDKERRRLRPLPHVRMPSFDLSDEEAASLATYFHAVSSKEAKRHAKKLLPLLQDTAKAQSTTTRPVRPEDVWPSEDWFTQTNPGATEPKYQLLADYLKEFALEHTLAKPNDFAATQPPEMIARAFQTAMFDARFVAKSFDSKYPFAEQFRPTPDPERFKKGETFFHLLQCHTCHVVGDDKNPGVNQAPKAPNLSLAWRRLRRDWVRHWVQEPQTMQPGNPMPSIFFSGRAIPSITQPERVIFELNGLPHVTSSPTPELAKQIQAQFGQTVQEQTDLLLDFIYAAGINGHTSIDPPQGEPKLPPTPGDFQAVPIPGITAPLPEPVKKAAPAPAPTPSEPAAPTQQVATGPSIVGKVLFEGTPPPTKPTSLAATPQCASQHPGGMMRDDSFVMGPNKGLKYVVVHVTKGLSGRFPVPSQPAILDQKGCRYEPHVLPLMAGQQVLVKNSDPFLHNVNGRAQLNPSFNFGQNNIDPGKPLPKLNTPEQFGVKCDVHPWMNSYLVVLNNPFFALTGDDGSFSINGLPPGNYTITTWHEKCPPVETQVNVEAGKPTDVSITLKLE